MPCLTHLSFTAGSFLSLLPPLLNTSKSLHVLIYLGLVAISGGHPAFVDLQSDPRFVFITNYWYLMDWQRAAHVGTSYWTRADDFIAKRYSGEMDGAH